MVSNEMRSCAPGSAAPSAGLASNASKTSSNSESLRIDSSQCSSFSG